MALQDAWGYDGKTYSGQEMRLHTAGLTAGRTGVSTPADMKAVPSSVPDNKVKVPSGYMIIVADAPGEKGAYGVPNDADLASPGFDATGADPRWDLLLLQVVTGVPQLTVVKGTAAGSPSYPSLAGYTNYGVICGVKMPANKSIIDNGANGVIEDRRSLWPVDVVCTSTTRPPIPFEGQRIYETDTDKWLTYTTAGTGWVPAWNMPWGIMAYDIRDTTAGPVDGTEATIADLSVAVTLVANRRVRVSLFVQDLYTDSAPTAGVLRIKEGAANIAAASASMNINNVGAGIGVATRILSPSAGTHTYTVTAQRTSGAGGVTIDANVNSPMLLQVEDIGPNAAPA